MAPYLGLSEPVIRLGMFALVFLGLAMFELWAPRLEREELRGALKSRRWRTNLALVLLSTALLRVVFPLGAVGVAMVAQAKGWGLLQALGLPPALAGPIAFVLLDLAVWAEHLASHKVGPLWRLHRTHHADPGLDVTTGLRFHPGEILVSMLWKSAVVLALGPPAMAVLVFEVVLNASSMFSHANIRLPKRLDAVLRWLVVTPDMHRVHHSARRRETDSNYGFNLSIWDRLFGTYVDRPKSGHRGIEIGLGPASAADATHLGRSLAMPLRRPESQ